LFLYLGNNKNKDHCWSATCIAITWRLSSSVNFWKKFFSSVTTWPIETKREHNCPCHFKTCIWNFRTLHNFHYYLPPISGRYQMCLLYMRTMWWQYM
jgi:hypothetical protein